LVLPSIDTRIGTDLLGYRIEALVGRGGMGVVYRAHDSRLKRNVALKLLSPEIAADVVFREGFLRESELAASVDHPNVIPIYEAGEVDGGLFIAMRFVEGGDLKKLLEGGALQPEHALGLAVQIADALDAAHRVGLVHGDVKPSNVLVAAGNATGGADHVYLSDFGLTRRVGERETTRGPLLATVDYVAPERIRGEAVDRRADIYSFGCVLYECLAGRPPFVAASDAALLFAHLEQQPPLLSEEGFPASLDSVIERVLAKAPAARYDSAQEFVAAVRSALGIAAPISPRWWWRTPALAALLGALLIVAAVGVFALSRGGSGTGAPPDADSLLRIDPTTNKVTAATAVGRKASAVAVGAGSVWVANFGDGTISRVNPRSGRVSARLPARGTPAGVAVSGSLVLVADGPDNGAIVGIDAATGSFSFSSPIPGAGVSAPLVAGGAAGAWFADADDGIVGRADSSLEFGAAATGKIQASTTSLLSAYRSFAGLAVGGDAVWVAGDAFEHAVWQVDATTGRVVKRIRLSFIPHGIAAGQGSLWVTSLLDDTVSRIDATTGRVVATIPTGRGADGVAVSANAIWITDSIDGTVTRIDPRTNRVVATIGIGGHPGALAVGAGAVWVVRGRP
jgi:YVTN family beta-propeller protein